MHHLFHKLFVNIRIHFYIQFIWKLQRWILLTVELILTGVNKSEVIEELKRSVDVGSPSRLKQQQQEQLKEMEKQSLSVLITPDEIINKVRKQVNMNTLLQLRSSFYISLHSYRERIGLLHLPPFLFPIVRG